MPKSRNSCLRVRSIKMHAAVLDRPGEQVCEARVPIGQTIRVLLRRRRALGTRHQDRAGHGLGARVPYPGRVQGMEGGWRADRPYRGEVCAGAPGAGIGGSMRGTLPATRVRIGHLDGLGIVCTDIALACVTSFVSEGVPVAACTRPESASAPTCAFMPRSRKSRLRARSIERFRPGRPVSSLQIPRRRPAQGVNSRWDWRTPTSPT